MQPESQPKSSFELARMLRSVVINALGALELDHRENALRDLQRAYELSEKLVLTMAKEPRE
jgi:hypothetical protein